MTKTVKIPFWGLRKYVKAWLLWVPAAASLSLSVVTDKKAFLCIKADCTLFFCLKHMRTPLWHSLQPSPLFFFHSKRETWACTLSDIVSKAEGISIQLKIVLGKWVASNQVGENFIRIVFIRNFFLRDTSWSSQAFCLLFVLSDSSALSAMGNEFQGHGDCSKKNFPSHASTKLAVKAAWRSFCFLPLEPTKIFCPNNAAYFDRSFEHGKKQKTLRLRKTFFI